MVSRGPEGANRGLYVHVPFCRSKCAYCDFYSVARPDMMEALVEALLEEWEARRGELGGPPTTLYLGGGTPTALPPALLGRLVSGLGLPPVAEGTIEANPEDVTEAFLDMASCLGLHRVSIGIQSFNDGLLRAVGRRHLAAEGRRALALLRQRGVNHSADLIYGLPGQSPALWEEDLRELLSYRPPHFSAYLLSYEEGTLLTRRLHRGELPEEDEDDAPRMYALLCRLAHEAGYDHYEISNFALPGRQSRHNSAYWTCRDPYLGLGPGAHSLDCGGTRRFNPADIRGYIRNPRNFAQADSETDTERLNDLIMTSLRTSRGLAEREVLRRFGPRQLEALLRRARGVPPGFVEHTPGGGLRIPQEAWLTADATVRSLLA